MGSNYRRSLDISIGAPSSGRSYKKNTPVALGASPRHNSLQPLPASTSTPRAHQVRTENTHESSPGGHTLVNLRLQPQHVIPG